MTSPPSIGGISAGIRYQVRFFWRHALLMLAPNPRVIKVVMEHHGVDAVDDVVVFYAPPGVNDHGAKVSADFFQVKFHVAHSGAVDHDTVLDPAWTGTKVAMIPRFAQAWTQITPEHPTARVQLVTNWAWNPTSPLARLIRDGGRLADQFLAATPKSKVGKIRRRWQDACGLLDAEFADFVNALRFSTSAVSQDDAELWLIDRCEKVGLVPVSHGADHSPYDDLGTRLIESGRTEQTPESLRVLVEKEGLVAHGHAPYKSTFAVRSFALHAHVPETDGACVVDLTDLFEARHIRSDDSWSGAIRERLHDVLLTVTSFDQPIHVALDAHLSIAWYVGFLLDPKAGVRVQLRQRVKGKGIEIWDVSTPRQPDGAPKWNVAVAEQTVGPDIAIVVSATHNALTDAARFVRASVASVGTILHAALPKLGPQAVQDGPHARWLADEVVRLLADKVSELRPRHVHLFLACPGSLAFLLGQEARALGPTTAYEYDFGDARRTYRPAMTTVRERPA